MVFIHNDSFTVFNEVKNIIFKTHKHADLNIFFHNFVIDIGNLVTKVPLLIHQISVICTRVQHSKHQRWFSKWPENLILSIIDQSTDLQVTVNHSVNTLWLSWLYGFCSFVLCFTDQITMKSRQSPFIWSFQLHYTLVKINVPFFFNFELHYFSYCCSESNTYIHTYSWHRNYVHTKSFFIPKYKYHYL